jgi:hypothetical protein
MMAAQNQPSLACLIERSAELKRALVDFALGPRMERHLERFMLESGPHEYRTYSNMGPAAFRPLPKHGFVYARLVPVRPVPDAWLVSEALLRRRKPWYYEHEPRPDRTVTGARLSELISQ